MRIVPVPCLQDNYAYLVIEGQEAIVIDASEAAPVLTALERERVTARAIWSTHHHWDHVGGNEELARDLSLPVVGHESDRGRLPGISQVVRDGERIRGAGLEAVCMHVPGHTLGAVAYFFEVGEGAVFTGDTLFCAGCGRLFEGTPAMMHASLARLGSLPGSCRVYCGHEYTESNLRFAAHLEPSSTQVSAARARAGELRAAGLPTVGSTMTVEQQVNPFLRLSSPELRATLSIPGEADDVETFAAVRRAKDTFR
jgi:hydroxyacylglutathione hydrolase